MLKLKLSTQNVFFLKEKKRPCGLKILLALMKNFSQLKIWKPELKAAQLIMNRARRQVVRARSLDPSRR